jgi:pimeloyl-ACP methyl ester carboxylesterase
MDLCQLYIEDQGGRYALGYADWGERGAGRTIVCVHGLTRNGRDFDHLAAVLAQEARVLCPDVVGRGRSDPLGQAADYAIPTYVVHMLQFIRQQGLEEVDWIGTSMGGLIGMGVAASEDSPVRRLVLNDIGPFLPKAALERINTYLGRDLRFADLRELETHLREVHAGFGPLTDEQWRHLAAHSACSYPDGRLGLAYDQRLGDPMRHGPIEDVDLWPVWDRIRCPVLLIRGQKSDLLTPETAAEMTRRGPCAELVEIEGVGHAPALMAEEQIEIVRGWLAR